jgi:hypothetical protein
LALGEYIVEHMLVRHGLVTESEVVELLTAALNLRDMVNHGTWAVQHTRGAMELEDLCILRSLVQATKDGVHTVNWPLVEDPGCHVQRGGLVEVAA